MAVTSIPRVINLNRHPADSDYVVLRPHVTIDGVVLTRGDRLPAHSPIRRSARRLEILCKQRVLSPQLVAATPAQAPSAKTPAASAAPPTTPLDVSTATVKELQNLCQQLGLKAHGNRNMLIKRLQQYQATA